MSGLGGKKTVCVDICPIAPGSLCSGLGLVSFPVFCVRRFECTTGCLCGGFAIFVCKKNITNYAVNIANIYSVIVVCCCYCCYCCLLLFYLPSVLFGFLKKKA